MRNAVSLDMPQLLLWWHSVCFKIQDFLCVIQIIQTFLLYSSKDHILKSVDHKPLFLAALCMVGEIIYTQTKMKTENRIKGNTTERI